MIQKAIKIQQMNLNQMTGFLKNRALQHCQVKVELVRRGRRLLGNFTQFSIIEKLWVPGAIVGVAQSSGVKVTQTLGPGSEREVLGQDQYLKKKKRKEKKNAT
jgi:hypothetical protein